MSCAKFFQIVQFRDWAINRNVERGKDKVRKKPTSKDRLFQPDSKPIEINIS